MPFFFFLETSSPLSWSLKLYLSRRWIPGVKVKYFLPLEYIRWFLPWNLLRFCWKCWRVCPLTCCVTYWLQSPCNSHFTFSTLPKHNTSVENHCSFSLSVFPCCSKFNWLAWSGICCWLLETFRSVNGTEAVLQLCYLSGKATLTLKVIQLEDIIPRCLATCVLPCHVAGGTIIICHLVLFSYTSGMWPSMGQPICWDRRQWQVLYPASCVSNQMVQSIL